MFQSPSQESVVSRSEVEQVFDTWRHSARRFGRDQGRENAERCRSVPKSDSGLGDGGGNGGGSSRTSPVRLVQPAPVYYPNSRPKRQQRRSRRFRTGDMQSDEINAHLLLQQDDKLKLPRLFPSKQPVTYGGRQSVGSPPHERRRFINVVRPMTVFPNPPPPPNFTLLTNHGGKLIGDPLTTNSQLPVRGRPPSPAPFRPTNPRNPPIIRPANFTVAGQSVNGGSTNRENGTTAGPGAANGATGSALRVNLAGGSGWDLTAIRKGYNNQKPGHHRPVLDNRFQYQGARYQSQGALNSEDKGNPAPPWNPHFSNAKVLNTQQTYPLTDDWRRQIDARRKALQRRRNRRRGVADGGTTILGNGDRLLNGISQTEEDFEELLRRAGDVESSAQTETLLEQHQQKRCLGPDMVDRCVQVVIEELPDFDQSVLPALELMVSHTLEQALIETIEEEEIKEIRQRRAVFQERKQAEMTQSKLMNVD